MELAIGLLLSISLVILGIFWFDKYKKGKGMKFVFTYPLPYKIIFHPTKSEKTYLLANSIGAIVLAIFILFYSWRLLEM